MERTVRNADRDLPDPDIRQELKGQRRVDEIVDVEIPDRPKAEPRQGGGPRQWPRRGQGGQMPQGGGEGGQMPNFPRPQGGGEGGGPRPNWGGPRPQGGGQRPNFPRPQGGGEGGAPRAPQGNQPQGN